MIIFFGFNMGFSGVFYMPIDINTRLRDGRERPHGAVREIQAKLIPVCACTHATEVGHVSGR